MQISCVDEHIAATDLEQLQSNREFLALPRFCVEVLQSSKEEVEIVRPQPLVSLVLEWAHKKWQDDNTVEIDQTFVEKSTLLIMSKDNTLQDCTGVEEGSEHDSDLIQDYKKSNQHLEKPKAQIVGRRKPGSSSAAVKPAKPKVIICLLVRLKGGHFCKFFKKRYLFSSLSGNALHPSDKSGGCLARIFGPLLLESYQGSPT